MSKLKLISCALIVAAIFFLSNQPASQSGAMSLVLAENLLLAGEKILPGLDLTADDIHNSLRKMAHFLIFLLLGFLMISLLKSMEILSLPAAIAALSICAVLALLDETHQFFIEGRSAELRDVLIDSAGAMVGIGIYLGIGKLMKSMSRRRKANVQLVR